MTEEKKNKIVETMGLIRSELLDLALYVDRDNDKLRRFATLGYVKSIDNLMNLLDHEMNS